MSNQGPLETGEKTVTRKQKDQIKQRNQSNKRQIVQRTVDNTPLHIQNYPESQNSTSKARKGCCKYGRIREKERNLGKEIILNAR